MSGGTTSEGMLQSLDERKAVTEFVVQTVKGRVPVVAHAGCIDTASTIELAVHARDAGADLVSAITPFFHGLNDESIYRHYLAVANAVAGFPILLYAYPGNAKNNISPQVVRQLVETTSNVVGIKSSNDDLVIFQEYVAAGGEGFLPISGVDELMVAGLALGSVGQVSGNANSFPEPFVALFQAYQDEDFQRAIQLQKLVTGIVNVHHAGATPAYYKASLKLRGLPAGRVRLPMRELSPEEFEEVKMGFEELGLL
jgi:4-hydroxy-tetrahydrodipicolinate synthase